jgi:hypothetical protein
MDVRSRQPPRFPVCLFEDTMIFRPCRKPLAIVVLIGVTALSHSPDGRGQKPPPPTPPNPQAPVLNAAAPLGMQRGTSLEITLTGTNLAGPTGILTSFPTKVTIPTDNKNGMDNAKLRIKLEVPADAPIGYHTIRLATTRGMSNLRLFCIDDLPQIVEDDKNRGKGTAQAVAVPSVVVGRADAEQSDYFKITVQPGQRVSFDLLGRRLGSAFDPQISIYHAKSNRELAHDNDAPGAQTDPRLTYTFKEAGDYLVEVKDVLNRGGADYYYRLRIGDFPVATVPVPLAAKRGGKATIQFAGPQVENVAPVELVVPADPAVNTLWVAPKGPNGLHGWPVALLVSDLDEMVEQEPNNEPGKALSISIPGAFTGRFQKSDDSDLYRFTAKKGQKLLIDGHTLELYSPTLLYMVLKNAKTGAEIAKSNPQAVPPADQRIDFTATEDGDYLLDVQHLNYIGGPSEVYRITVTPSQADFGLTLPLDRYDLAPGSFVPLNVQAVRRGYNGPIDVSVQGPPEVSGSVTIKQGQASAVLILSAKPEMQPGPHRVRLVGKATIDGKPVMEYVSVRTPVSQSLAGLPFPPRDLHNQIALAVREKAPFAIVARFEPAEIAPGTPTSLVLQADRQAGFEEEIAFNAPTGFPPNEKPPAVKSIPKGQKEVKLPISFNAKVPFGEYQILVTAKTKTKDKEFLVNALPAKVTVTQPFELKVDAPLKLTPGGKGKLKVSAVRKGSYSGPIALEVRKLPANVTAGKGMIAMGQTAAEIEVAAAANATPGPKTDVDVLGTATALNNLQNASPAFTVTIEKK